MNKIYLFCALLLVSTTTRADWFLEQSEDGHWITTYSHNNDQQQLIVSKNKKGKQFILILPFNKATSSIPSKAIFTIDNNIEKRYKLKLIKRRENKLALQLIFSNKEQDDFIGKLVIASNLMVSIRGLQDIHFSLLGFTDEFSNLLIASEIGVLNLFWLHGHGKYIEMMCYEAATLTVQAMLARQQGVIEYSTLTILLDNVSTGILNILPDLVSAVYRLSDSQFPQMPIATKYGIFKRCMKSMK